MDEADELRAERGAQRLEALLGGGLFGGLRLGDQRADPVGLAALGDHPAQVLDHLGQCGPRRRRRCRSGCGPAASRRARRGPCRRRRRARGCAGSASRSSRGCRRPRPSAPRSMRWRTPKRCCSSTIARRRSRKATSRWKRAWVPTRMPISPAASARELRGTLAALVAAGQEREADAGGLGEGTQRLEVLAGEDLGRGHQRRLAAGLDGGEHGEERHQGLAGADVALQQAVHPAGLGHVGGYLGDGAGLGGGRRVGKRGEHPVAQPAVAGGRRSPWGGGSGRGRARASPGARGARRRRGARGRVRPGRGRPVGRGHGPVPAPRPSPAIPGGA